VGIMNLALISKGQVSTEEEEEEEEEEKEGE
jgi:hypothetical protein